MHRQGDHELGLAAAFKSKIVGTARVLNFLNDLTQLIDLNRKNPAVAPAVVFLFDRLRKEFIQSDHSRAQQILNADRER